MKVELTETLAVWLRLMIRNVDKESGLVFDLLLVLVVVAPLSSRALWPDEQIFASQHAQRT